MDISSASRVHKNEWTKSGIRFFRSSDVVASFNKKKNTEAFISHELYEKLSSKSGKVCQGDILITGGGSIGIPYLIKDEEPLYFKDADLIWLKNSGKLNGYFLFTYFVTNGFRQYLESISHIGTISHYTIEQAKVTPISLPNKNEQDKIGVFFDKLDNTIALHLCKQRQLELLKQRLIKEILPQSDSTLPHLRFANFRKPWEQHQLKEVLKVNSGRDYKHLNEGNIPVYGTGGYMLSVDGKLSDVDGIGLGRKGTIDKPQYLKAPFWTVDTLFYLTPSPNYDIYFLYTLIQNVNWKSMDESTGVPSLSKSVIERVTLTFPILEEQQKIGSFFREFDNTISLHQQKIAHLKALKSTILNKMFI